MSPLASSQSPVAPPPLPPPPVTVTLGPSPVEVSDPEVAELEAPPPPDVTKLEDDGSALENSAPQPKRSGAVTHKA